MHMKSAETIKCLKETSDRLLDLVGNLATYNAIFLYDILGKKMIDREFSSSKVKVKGSVEGKKIIGRD